MAFEDDVTTDSPELWWDTRQASGVSQPDRSGNGHTGTITGGPTLDADGLTFDGSGQFVQSANIPPASYAAFALEAVVRPDVLTPYFGSIFNIYQPTLVGDMALYVLDDPNDPGNLIYGGDAADAADTRFVFETGDPPADPIVAGLQHLLLDFDGTDITLYLDGAVYGTRTGAAFDVDLVEATPFVLGDDIFGPEGFIGLIRHGIFYDHALGPTRAAAHATAALTDDGDVAPSSSFPTLVLSADFTGGTEDITQYVEDFPLTITRGSTALDIKGYVADAGTLTDTLQNIERTFDPNYAAGPFFGDLVPGVPTRAVISWDAVDYPLFTGRVDGWPQDYPNDGVEQIVALRATDALAKLATAAVDITRPAEKTGARIAAVLAAWGWTGATSIDPGVSYVPALVRGTSVSLSHVSDCVMVEWGEFYVAKDEPGTLTFRDRNSIATDARSSVSQATYVQSGGLNFSALTRGELQIVNEIVVSWSDSGKQVTVRDEDSVDMPWSDGTPRSLSISLPMMTASQARSYARWLLLLYANYINTVTSITFQPDDAIEGFDQWAEVLTRELGDRVTVVLDPLSSQYALSGAPLTRDCVIRGITYNFSTEPQSVTFALQDQTWMDNLFIWDTSELDGPDIYGM